MFHLEIYKKECCFSSRNSPEFKCRGSYSMQQNRTTFVALQLILKFVPGIQFHVSKHRAVDKIDKHYFNVVTIDQQIFDFLVKPATFGKI